MLARIKSLFTRKSAGITDYHPITTQDLIARAYFGNVTLDASAALEMYRQSSAVSTAVDFIASKIEAIEPMILQRNGDMTDESPVLDLLKSPNGFMDWPRFVGAAVRYRMITGSTYFHAIGNTRAEPVEVYVPHGSAVDPLESGLDDYPDRYQLTRRQQSRLFTLDTSRRRQGFGYRYYSGALEELFPVRGFSSRLHALRPDSPLEAVLLEIQQHIQGRQHNNSLLQNGARPSSVWFIKQKIGEEAFDLVEATIAKKFNGSQNTGRAIVVNGAELDFKDLIVNNRDMDFANLDKVAKEAIYARYRIPIPLISADRQTFNNY